MKEDEEVDAKGDVLVVQRTRDVCSGVQAVGGNGSGTGTWNGQDSTYCEVCGLWHWRRPKMCCSLPPLQSPLNQPTETH